jgi:hypothetical protein
MDELGSSIFEEKKAFPFKNIPCIEIEGRETQSLEYKYILYMVYIINILKSGKTVREVNYGVNSTISMSIGLETE